MLREDIISFTAIKKCLLKKQLFVTQNMIRKRSKIYSNNLKKKKNATIHVINMFFEEENILISGIEVVNLFAIVSSIHLQIKGAYLLRKH